MFSEGSGAREPETAALTQALWQRAVPQAVCHAGEGGRAEQVKALLAVVQDAPPVDEALRGPLLPVANGVVHEARVGAVDHWEGQQDGRSSETAAPRHPGRWGGEGGALVATESPPDGHAAGSSRRSPLPCETCSPPQAAGSENVKQGTGDYSNFSNLRLISLNYFLITGIFRAKSEPKFSWLRFYVMKIT